MDNITRKSNISQKENCHLIFLVIFVGYEGNVSIV